MKKTTKCGDFERFSAKTPHFSFKKPAQNPFGRLGTLTAARQRGARIVKVPSNAPSLKVLNARENLHFSDVLVRVCRRNGGLDKAAPGVI